VNQTEYFASIAYQPKYKIGARIRGTYQGIPIRGSVFNDTLVCLDDGPYVTVHLDLPVQVAGKLLSVVKCSHDQVSPVK
jgi:hypothetical protein